MNSLWAVVDDTARKTNMVAINKEIKEALDNRSTDTVSTNQVLLGLYKVVAEVELVLRTVEEIVLRHNKTITPSTSCGIMMPLLVYPLHRASFSKFSGEFKQVSTLQISLLHLRQPPFRRRRKSIKANTAQVIES